MKISLGNWANSQIWKVYRRLEGKLVDAMYQENTEELNRSTWMRSCLLMTLLGLVCSWFLWMPRPHTMGNLSHDGCDGYEHCMRGKSNAFSLDPTDTTGEMQAGVGWGLAHLFLPVLDSSQHATCHHNIIKEQVAIKVMWLVRQWKKTSSMPWWTAHKREKIGCASWLSKMHAPEQFFLHRNANTR